MERASADLAVWLTVVIIIWRYPDGGDLARNAFVVLNLDTNDAFMFTAAFWV